MRKRLLVIIMIALSFLLTLGAIASGVAFRSGSNRYELVVSQPSHVTLFAPRQVMDFVATEENRAAAYAFAQNRYLTEQIREIDHGVWLQVERNIEARFSEIFEIRAFYYEEIQQINLARAEWEAWYDEQNLAAEIEMYRWYGLLANWLEAGGEEADFTEPRPAEFTLADDDQWVEPVIDALDAFDNIPNVHFTAPQRHYLLYMTEYELETLWEITWTVAHAIQTSPITELEGGEMERVLVSIRNALPAEQPAIINDIAYQIMERHLQQNHFINHEANEARRIEDEANYEEVFVQEGLILVQEGHIVTANAYAILEYLGYVGGEDDFRTVMRDALFPLIGTLVLTAALFFAAIMYLYFYRPTIVTTQKEAALLFVLYVMVMVLIWVLRDQPYMFLPILVFPMLVSMLIDRRCAIMLNTAVVLLGYFIIDGTLMYLLFYMVTGMVVCLLSRYTTQRSKIILVGFLVTAIASVLWLAITFTMERAIVIGELQEHLLAASFAGINGLLVVIICVGSLPFWEALFGVVTPIKLLDLTNPTNLLLRRLTIEAPGTYHHSLMVANLAESAAYDIDANAHAARVGGYYHDVGKLKYPHFFAENISGENPHDHMEPINSAGLLVSHVSHGLTLAAQHRLPQFVRDIISEHHGTSMMQFFYKKAKDIDPYVQESDYRYPYSIPQTRESACVMLADTVEAAVRSMMPKISSFNEVDVAIRKLIRDKLADGQLADSQLSIKDLDTIEASFARVLKSAHHERIAYPKIESVTESVDPRDPPLLIRGMVEKEAPKKK